MEIGGVCQKSEICDAAVRRKERRMALPEWTKEVRQMVSKAVSGQLDLPIQYPPSKWTYEIDDDNIKGALESSSNKAQIKACQPGAQEWPQAEKETEEQKPVYSTEGESSQLSANEAQTECDTSLCKDSAISVSIEDICGVQPQELCCSLPSSPDTSEEFLTPDSDIFFCCPVLQENLEPQHSSPKEREDFHKVCEQQEFPLDAVQRYRFFCGAEPHLQDDVPGEDLFIPAASTGRSALQQDRRPGEVLKEFKEEEA